MNTKTILLSILIVSFTFSGIATTDKPKVQQSNAGPNIEMSDGQVEGLFDRISGLVFDFTGVQSTYTPGEDISIEIEAMTETSYDTADATKVVEIYECADSSCDTPPPIDSSSEDQCSEREWAPEYDDCIAKDSDGVSYSTVLEPGNTWSWDASFNGLDRESKYVLVGYVWTPDQNIVSDVSKKEFTVESSDSDSDTGDTGSTGEAEIREVDGDIPVKFIGTGEDMVLQAEPEFTNVGDADMADNDIVEMQVRPEGSDFLSAIPTVSPQRTCDSDHPENVHREYFIPEGSTLPLPLSVPVSELTRGETYDVKIITAEECGGDFVEPYSTGVTADTVKIPELDTGGSDSDGDGLEDSVDECPEKAGPESNNGCPTNPGSDLPIGLLGIAAGVSLIVGWVIAR